MAESFVLNTGARIPSVGLGVWQIQPDAAVNAIYAAVKVRIRIRYILCYALGLYSVDYKVLLDNLMCNWKSMLMQLPQLT